MRLLAELAGDVPQLAEAEFLAAFEAHGTPFTVLQRERHFLDGHAEVFHDDVQPILARLGLAHTVAQHLYDGDPAAWDPDEASCCFPRHVRFAVRGTRLDAASPWRVMDVERSLGALMAGGRKVDLAKPDTIVNAFLAKGRVYVGTQLLSSDPKALADRHVVKRPFSNPVSIAPRLGRALVNLTRVRPGQTLYDPFVGTGGLLLEAAAMGVKVLGSDLEAAMVDGTRRNLAHFGHTGILFQSDIRDAPVRVRQHAPAGVDAIVSDLPYGRSSNIQGGKLDVYAAAFQAAAEILPPGGHAVLGLPEDPSSRTLPPGLELRDVQRVRAHKSLTRHYAVLRHA